MQNDPFLPASESVHAAPRFQTPPPRRILVVDRDPYVCHLSADVLIRHGFEVNAAGDGAAGWEELQANPYHLLIIEHQLPKLSGVKLVQKLRAARMALPVVLVTEKLPPPALTRDPSLRLAALLVKPLAYDRLLATVQAALHARNLSSAQNTSPPEPQFQPVADSWQKQLIAADAGDAVRGVQFRDSFIAYAHWGLNE